MQLDLASRRPLHLGDDVALVELHHLAMDGLRVATVDRQVERAVLTRDVEDRVVHALVVVGEEPGRAFALVSEGGGQRLEPVAVEILGLVDDQRVVEAT